MKVYIIQYFLFFLVFRVNLIAQNVEQEYQSLVKSREYTKALNKVEEGIKQNPSNYPLYLLQVEGSLYLYSSNKDTSEQLLNKAYQHLLKYLQYNKINDTFKTLSAQLSIPIYRKAAIYMNFEQYNLAKDWFSKTIQLKSWANEKDNDLFFYTGLSAYNAEDYQLAEKYFSMLIQEKYNNAAVYEILANYYYQNKAYSKSKDIILNALNNRISINKETEILILFILEHYNSCNEFNELNKQYKWSKSDNVDFKKVIARIYYLCGDTISCIQQYTEIYNKYPTDTTVLIQCGLVYYNRGIKYLQEAKNVIAKSDKNIDTYRKLKTLYIDDIKSAIFYIEHALKYNVSSQKVILCLYKCYKHLQRKEEMVKLKSKYPFLND